MRCEWPHDLVRFSSQPGSAPLAIPTRESLSLLTVTADTPVGLVVTHPFWPAMLDGILAWVDRRVIRGVRPEQHDRHRPVLPLAFCRPPDGKAQHGSWCASRGWWQINTPVEAQPWGRRTDQPFHRAMGVGGRINVSTGADKSKWTNDLVTLTPRVTWKAVGHAPSVRRWLDHVECIGDSTGRGQGRVEQWRVRSDPLPAQWRYVEMVEWIGGAAGRPLHPRWATHIAHHGGTTAGTQRPPYVDPAATAVGRQSHIEVLAP